MTNELESGDYITKCISGGPKNYAYITKKDKQVCKVRGFSLNYANTQHINFESIYDLITTKKRQVKRKVLDCSEYEPCLKKSKTIDLVNPTKNMS